MIEPLTIEINGNQYVGIKRGSVYLSMENLSNEFSVEISKPANVSGIPFHRGDECKVLIYGKVVLTGFINRVEAFIDNTAHVITIYGRDKTSDIVDNTLPAKISFSAPISLSDITKKVISLYGISDIDVIVDIEESLPIFSKNEMVAAEMGERCFDFLEKYAKKRQVLLTTDGQGNIVYTRAKDVIIDDFINVNEGINKGNVLSIQMNLDDSHRYYKYVVVSQTNASGTALTEENEPTEEENMMPENELETFRSQNFTQPLVTKETYLTSEAIDDEIRTTREYHFVSDTSLQTQDELNNRAIWEANMRRANGFDYTIVVQGFKNSKGFIWQPNMQININDNINDVQGEFLILSLEFSVEFNSGTRTVLHLVTPECYKMKIYKKEKAKKKQTKKADSYQSTSTKVFGEHFT
jgi:prophage tail gpP-like protein